MSAPTSVSTLSPASSSASVAFTIAIPAASASSTTRQLRYISAGTKSAAVTYNGKKQVLNCTTSCAGTIQVASGPQTFTAALFDGLNATGNQLAQGQTQAVIVPGQVNYVQITFDGIIASVAVALGSTTIPAGTAASIPVIVHAKDAAGYTIVGSAPFSAPIALSDDDTSGATKLSISSLTAPGGATLSYDGSGNGSVVHVGAAITGTSISAIAATLTIASRPVSTPMPTTAPTPQPTVAPTPGPVPTTSGTVLWKAGDATLGQTKAIVQTLDGQCGNPVLNGTTYTFNLALNGTTCYRNQATPASGGLDNQVLTDGRQYTWTFHYSDGPTGMGYDQDARSLIWQIHDYNASDVCTALGFDNSGNIGAPQVWNFANDCNGAINWRGAYTAGEQDDWKIQALISSTSAGWVKLYRNGTLVYSGSGPNYTSLSQGGPWWNFGPYKWRWELPTGVGSAGNVTTLSTVGATFSNMVLTTP